MDADAMPFVGHTLDDFTDEQVVAECQERGYQVAPLTCESRRAGVQFGDWVSIRCDLPHGHPLNDGNGGGHRFAVVVGGADRPAVVVTECPGCDLPVGDLARRYGRCNACGEPLCAMPLESDDQWEARRGH